MSISRRVLTGFLLFTFCVTAGLLQAKTKEPVDKEIPLTTKSPEARKLFLEGRMHRENWHAAESLQAWRAAAQKDPDFALAHLYISLNTPDPKEEVSARAEAKRLAPQTSHGEQMLIQWLIGAREGNYVGAIVAMNDLLALYPKDKWLLFQAGRWMSGQRSWEKGESLLLRALAIDPNYTPALNQLGYLYASYGPQFEKSFKQFERYARLLPQEPNPQDSWAEISRMAGEYQQALDHYRKALQIDPKYSSSQLGIADTYALMGDQTRARTEYEKAIEMTPTPRGQMNAMAQLALTYVREGNFEAADQNYEKVAQKAHEAGMVDMEAECHRYMAMYEPDSDKAIAHLDAAEKIIRQQHSLAPGTADMAISRILLARAWRASKSGRTGVIASTTAELEKLSAKTGNNLIRQNYHAAAGMLALAHGKYADAVSHLEEEDHFTHMIGMEQLALAYDKVGNHGDADKLRAELKHMNLPGIDQVVVINPMRTAAAAALR